MGVGTLIIFIAMLLVAAVAAGVLLQTAGALQQRALVTGSQTRAEISTNVRVIEVSAVDGTDQTLENFSMQLKLAPGSDPIKLSEVTFTFNTFNSGLTLSYDNATGANASSNVTTGVGTFTAEYLINGSNHIDGNLQRGDVLRVHWVAGQGIGEDTEVRINWIPKIGTATLVEFTTPDVISTQTAFLYP
jgi:archaellin